MIDRTGSRPNQDQLGKYFGCLNDTSSSLIKTILVILQIKRMPETYSKPCQTTNMELFAKQATDGKQLTIFTKRFILDVW